MRRWVFPESCSERPSSDSYFLLSVLKKILSDVKLHDIMDRKDLQARPLASPNYSPDQEADQIQASSTFLLVVSHLKLLFLAFALRTPTFNHNS